MGRQLRINTCLALIFICASLVSFVNTARIIVRTPQPRPTIVPCYCIYYLSCINGSIDDTGSLVLNERLNVGPKKTTPAPNSELGSMEPRYHGDKCPRPGEVCCYLGTPPATEPATTPTEPTTIPTTTTTATPWLTGSGCGWVNPYGLNQRSGSPKLLGKNDVYQGQYPWQGAILRVDPSSEDMVFKCGATLINHYFVLTAAHCVYDKQQSRALLSSELRLRLGVTNIKSNDEAHPYQDYDVSSVIIHPQYNAQNLRYDAALLAVTGYVKYAAHINPVCLPKSGDSQDNYVDQVCVALGWGKNSFIKGQFQSNLQAVNLGIVDHAKCEVLLKNTTLTSVFRLHDSFVCAGGKEGYDTCTGDGGGPLACQGPDQRFIEIGITSWGVQCGQKNVPGVYADVAYLSNWIRQTIRGHGQ